MKMKKLVGGLNKLQIIIFYFFLLFFKSIQATQIYDFQTEEFIKRINSLIISVNSFDKNIPFKIINDDFPNAYVTENNTIYLSSGLIVHSPDYVSLLGVLAHEVGHIENYHIKKRKKEINDLKNINSLGNFASLIGSMIIKEPGLLNAIVVNETTINNLYINFSQEQEIEADMYAIKTINRLNLPTDSIKEFLILLEKKTKFNLIDSELRKFSTHPIFEKRHEIVEFESNLVATNFNKKLQDDFEFIKVKFMAYTNIGNSKKLKGDLKTYHDAIQYSKTGNLYKSLRNINSLIEKKNNNFLLETKADILLSYGYKNEAIKFYKKILETQPNNNYAQYNIFTNIDFEKKNFSQNKDIFLKNLHLIDLFPKDHSLLRQYYHLSDILDFKEWELFFEIILLNKNYSKEKLSNLQKNTKDNNLKKSIKIYN